MFSNYHCRVLKFNAAGHGQSTTPHLKNFQQKYTAQKKAEKGTPTENETKLTSIYLYCLSPSTDYVKL
jgi:hypothetical protein